MKGNGLRVTSVYFANLAFILQIDTWPETVAMVPLVPFFRYGNTGSAFCISSHLCPLVFDDGA